DATVLHKRIEALLCHEGARARIETIKGGFEGIPLGVDYLRREARVENASRHFCEHAIIGNCRDLRWLMRSGLRKHLLKRRDTALTLCCNGENLVEMPHCPLLPQIT